VRIGPGVVGLEAHGAVLERLEPRIERIDVGVGRVICPLSWSTRSSRRRSMSFVEV